jgi:methyl-accepting chemotaxis protein
MKIRYLLYGSAIMLFAGLAALAAVSVYAIHDIREIIGQLTDRSTPLQIKTTELQRSIESLTGVLLRLGVATDKTEVAELSTAVDERLTAVKGALDGIKTLDATQAGTIDISIIDNVYRDVKQAAGGRLENLASFREESQKVNESINHVEQALADIRKDMQNLTQGGARTLSRSVEATTGMIGSVQKIKDLVISLKEIQIVLKDLELAKKTPEILANKSKLKGAISAIQSFQIDDDAVNELKKQLPDINNSFTKADSGLFALKQGALKGQDTAGAFTDEKRRVMTQLIDLAVNLDTATAKIEHKAEQNRKDADSALNANQRINAVVDKVSGITLGVKGIDAKVRTLMLSATRKDADAVAAGIRDLFARIDKEVASARKELSQLKQQGALKNLNAAAGAVMASAASVERIIAAQGRIIDSNEKAAKALDMVKTAANKELKNGENLMRNTADVQKKMVEKTTSAATRMSALIMIIAGVIAVMAAIPLVFTIRRITLSLSTVTAMVQDIAEGEGDLTKRLDESGKDEFAMLAHWFNLFLAKLNATMSTVAANTRELTCAAAEMREASVNISSAAENVAGRGATAATASEEMAATAADISRNCQMVSDSSLEADQAAKSGADVVRETINAMERIAANVRSSASTVEALGERSEQIGQIVSTISDIADQTNLLALNAAIEAARAGEQGMGFAVVADEVRRLAERTTEATREIGDMIRAIQNETASAVRSMEEGVRQVETGGEKAAHSGSALQQILAQITELNLQVAQIATAAEEQTATTNEINTTIQQMTDEVGTTAQSAGRSAETATRLAGLASELERLVGQFRLA